MKLVSDWSRQKCFKKIHKSLPNNGIDKICQRVILSIFKKNENLILLVNHRDMVDVQKIEIVSFLRPVNLPPSRAHLVVYEPSYKEDVPVPTK